MAILAAIDGTERSTQVVEIAHDLATTYEDTLVALHVIPTEDYREHREAIRDIPEFEDFSIDQEMDSAERFAREFVKETLGAGETGEVEPRGRVGDVAEEVLAEADALDPRYLVLSGRRRSPAGKAIFGNTTQRILLNADHPVVTKMGDD